MKAADDVFDAQAALDSNSGDLDNALIDVANAVGRDAARRGAAQAKVDTATQTDATLRSALTAAQTQLESLRRRAQPNLARVHSPRPVKECSKRAGDRRVKSKAPREH